MNVTKLTDLLKTNIDGLDKFVLVDEHDETWTVKSDGDYAYLIGSDMPIKILDAYTQNSMLYTQIYTNEMPDCPYIPMKVYKTQRFYV